MHKIVQVLSLAILFSSFQLRAQTAPPVNDFSLEDELNPTVQANDENVSETTTSRMAQDDEDSVELVEDEYAINGFSFGVLGLTQTYDIKASILINGNQTVDLNSKSSEIQSAGVVLRYAILPLEKLGTDINVSFGSTLDSSNVGYGAISFAKAVLNFGYAIPFGSTNSIYFLGGGGYEYITGKDIEEIQKAGGAVYQVGAGIGLGKKFNVEVFYSYSQHALNDDYIRKAGDIAINQGATTYTGQGSSSVTAQSITGRINYTY